jgi:hypothetical protein
MGHGAEGREMGRGREGARERITDTRGREKGRWGEMDESEFYYFAIS